MQQVGPGRVAVADVLHDAVNEAILPLLPVSATRILDVGCGTGTWGAWVQAERPTVQVTGITMSPGEATLAQTRLHAVYVLDLNEPDAPLPPGPFDAIVCSHVVGYLHDAEGVLRRLGGLLAPSGVLIAAIPNVLHWRQRWQFVRGRFDYHPSGGVLCRHYVRFFDRHSAPQLLRDAGHTVDRVQVDGYIPLPGVRRILPDMACALDRRMAAWFPGLLATEFIIVARRQEA